MVWRSWSQVWRARVRRLGMARDLDVLRQRLEQDLMGPLPEEERKALKPVLKQLRRERGLAYEQLVAALQAGGYLKLLSQLPCHVHARPYLACCGPLDAQ